MSIDEEIIFRSINLLDDVNKSFYGSVAVKILEESFVLLNQLIQSQSVEPNSIVHIPAEEGTFYTEQKMLKEKNLLTIETFLSSISIHGPVLH